MLKKLNFDEIIIEIDKGYKVYFSDTYKHLIFKKDKQIIITSERYPEHKLEMQYDNPYSLSIIHKTIQSILKNSNFSVDVV